MAYQNRQCKILLDYVLEIEKFTDKPNFRASLLEF